jgi:SAM-dependent methyltransferase
MRRGQEAPKLAAGASRPRSLVRVRNTWDRWGREDPLFGVLSEEGSRGNRWELDAFFATGRQSLVEIVARLEALGLRPSGTALDFGCGVGRLTQALLPYVEEAHGVDISPAMLENARRFAPDGAPITFWENARDDLRLFEDESFSFVISALVLQHMPPPLARRYLGELVRVLRPGGCGVVQLPEAHRSSGKLLDSRRLPPALRNRAVRMKAAVLRRPFMEMHMFPRADVVETVTAAGGQVVDVTYVETEFCHSLEYVFAKPSRTPTDA